MMAVVVKRLRQRHGPGLVLICVPYAGGSAAVFHCWGRYLPEFVELYAVDLPGRDRLIRHPPITEMTELVGDLASAVTPHLSGPFVVFGHSMGALVGFELVRELRRRRQPPPDVLIVSGHPAPHLDDRHPPLHQLPDREFIDQLRGLCGFPDEVIANDELLALFLPVLRADFQLCETYEFRREQPLACRIVALGGRDDAEISPCRLEAWQEQTSGSFRLALFEGGHLFIHSNEEGVVRVVCDELEALQGHRQDHHLA
jgi:surfactin synthase thioesterase subunit